MRNGQLFFDTLIFIEFGRNFDFFMQKTFSVRFGGAVFDDFGAVGRSVGRSVPRPPLAPKEVWSDIASSVCELSLVWRR